MKVKVLNQGYTPARSSPRPIPRCGRPWTRPNYPLRGRLRGYRVGAVAPYHEKSSSFPVPGHPHGGQGGEDLHHPSQRPGRYPGLQTEPVPSSGFSRFLCNAMASVCCGSDLAAFVASTIGQYLTDRQCRRYTVVDFRQGYLDLNSRRPSPLSTWKYPPWRERM